MKGFSSEISVALLLNDSYSGKFLLTFEFLNDGILVWKQNLPSPYSASRS